MDQAMREQLAKKGWQVGTVSEFLNITPEEATLIAIRASASKAALAAAHDPD